MRFDLFYELAVPEFAHTNERDVYHHSLDEIEAADAAGFDGTWAVEHHFFREYSHCSAPEVFLAAVSQRTKRMRIGHAVVLLPFNHPVRVAERIAALDVLSDGRIDVGVGRGVSPLEYDVFGGSMSESRDRVDEGLEILKRCWAQEPFSFEGEFWSFPEIDTLPKPVQTPHPPLWTAAVSPDTFTIAAERGLHVLVGPFKPLFMIAEDRESFERRCRELGREGLGFGMTVGVVVGEDRERARQIARTNIRWFYEQLLRLTGPVLERGGESYRYYKEELGTLRQLTGGTPSLEALEEAGMVIAGDPEDAVAGFRRLREHGIEHVLCALQAGGVPHGDVMESIRLFGEHVIPALGENAAVSEEPSTNGQERRPKRPDMRVFLRAAEDIKPAALFQAMPLVFRSHRANGFEALYRVDLKGEDGGTWWVSVRAGECQVTTEDPGRKPDVRFRSSVKTWVDIARGERNPTLATLLGRLRVKGDRRKALMFGRLFG